MQLNITGYSTALFSTWYFIEELHLLLDAGDGLTAALMQKARKIEHVFVSHADRDHLTGLLQFNQLNARPGFPRIYYPLHCGSFPALEAFSKRFDPHVEGTVWQALRAGEQVQIRDNIWVEAIRNEHFRTDENTFKSFGYRVFETRSKLKKEFSGLPQPELLKQMAVLGKDAMTEQIRSNILTYSGDTPVDGAPEKWDNTRVLIHEATFLTREESEHLNTRANRHSSLEEVIEMAAGLNIECLILGHFSTRYSREQIDEAILTQCRAVGIRVPVYRVLPGAVHRNILGGEPIWG